MWIVDYCLSLGSLQLSWFACAPWFDADMLVVTAVAVSVAIDELTAWLTVISGSMLRADASSCTAVVLPAVH